MADACEGRACHMCRTSPVDGGVCLRALRKLSLHELAALVKELDGMVEDTRRVLEVTERGGG